MSAHDGGVEETSSPSSSASPTSRVKFFCSFGGRILPRPDGVLKYVGGDTRVVAVPRNVGFSELTNKLSNLLDGDFVLKYQIASEDLDSLVSVKSDEDLRHMLDEYDRLESEGQLKLRTFLFPSKPVIIETGQNPFLAVMPHSIEQRFVDAINGVVRRTKRPLSTCGPVSASSSPDSASPHSLSPPSATHNHTLTISEQPFVNGPRSGLSQVHRVHSSPTLCSLSNHHQISNPQSGSCNHYNPCCHYCHGHRHQHCYGGCQSHCRPPDHPVHQPLHPMVRAEYGKSSNPYSRLAPLNIGYSRHPFDGQYPGSGGRNKWGNLGDITANAVCSSNYAPWHFARAGSVPRSPRDSKEAAWA
ncbi:hypothetical protein Droror1_Dr00013948 [Drosera rotundifolia]